MTVRLWACLPSCFKTSRQFSLSSLGLFLLIPGVCSNLPSLSCVLVVPRVNPHRIDSQRCLSGSSPVSSGFSLLFHRSCPLFTLFLSAPPPTCLSVILTFTLCLSVPVTLYPPLYFSLSSWGCFSAEVSVDSSYFLPDLLCSHPPCPTSSLPLFPRLVQIRQHIIAREAVSTRTHTALFLLLDHRAISVVLSLCRAILRSVRENTLHFLYLGIRPWDDCTFKYSRLDGWQH